MSRYENHIETGSGTKNGLFKVYLDYMLLYMIMKWRKFKIGIGAVEGV